MKNILRRQPKLKQLVDFTLNHLPAPTQVAWGKQEITSSRTSPMFKGKFRYSLNREQAATTIQRAWRRKALVNALDNDPYATYLSLVDGLDKPISALMFGRRIAELDKVSPDYIHNPFAHQVASYHRLDDLAGPMIKHLLDRFGVNKATRQKNYYVPLVKLQNTPLDTVIKNIYPSDMQPPTILADDNHSIVLLQVSKSESLESFCELLSYVSVHGLLASPWELALNSLNMDMKARLPNTTRSLAKHLPNSLTELLTSDLFKQLKTIAHDTSYPTHHLAKCLMRLLKGLPETEDESIQRIATLLDATNTIYANNYSKYAFCVYTITHEISIILLQQHSNKFADISFTEFTNECKQTFLSAYGLQLSDLNHSEYIAIPATCGSNAYVTALDIARKMKTPTGNPPQMKYCNPLYFEFEKITDSVTSYKSADIFIISAGPMVTLDGLTPGIDINQFVKRHIIDAQVSKPITLVVDTTTTLYKNLALTTEVKNLVKTGQLSIILFESNQKFGLLHTDQAQYGRVFGIYGAQHYPHTLMKQCHQNATLDFQDHLDMRIGAYISTQCRDLLEDIKQAHFHNGALFQDMLHQCNNILPSIMPHDAMQLNQNEHYFIAAPQETLRLPALSVFSYRGSFGHFATTTSTVGEHLRISPHASDRIDGLIDVLQLSLAKEHSPMDLVLVYVGNANAFAPLSLAEQMVTIAIANVICKNFNPKDVTSPESLLKLYAALATTDQQCRALNGRDCVTVIHRFQQLAREALSVKFTPENSHDFFQAMKILYRQGIQLDQDLIDICAKNYKLCKAIGQYRDVTICKTFIMILSESPELVTKAICTPKSDTATLNGIRDGFNLSPQEMKRREFAAISKRIGLLPAASLPTMTKCVLNGTLPQQLTMLIKRLDRNTLEKRPQHSWLYQVGIKNSYLSACRTSVAERLISQLQNLLTQYQETQQVKPQPECLYLLELQALHLLKKAKEANDTAFALFARPGFDKIGSLNHLLTQEMESIGAFRQSRNMPRASLD